MSAPIGVGPIRVGIGGWSFEPWRGTFYPDKLPHKRELAYVGERLTATEINATYHRLQKPESFANWAAAVPDGFVFAVKGSRYVTNRRVLAEAGESVGKFLDQGIVELGDKLGPILWQFMATKKFEADDFAAFLALLPPSRAGVKLRHVIQVRHESFACPEFIALMRKAGLPICYADSAGYPAIADITGDFVYARLENAQESAAAGYAPEALDGWAEAARNWAAGGAPAGLPYVDASAPPKQARETFVFMINGFKPKAPAAALALLERLRA